MAKRELEAPPASPVMWVVSLAEDPQLFRLVSAQTAWKAWQAATLKTDQGVASFSECSVRRADRATFTEKELRAPARPL